MKWIEGKKTDPEAIREALKKGYRTEHPERTAGYCGFFFSPGDVYLSCRVAEFIRVPEFRDFVLDALKRFDAGDWGLISGSDVDENTENRYLFGIDRLFGRYGYPAVGQSSGETRCREYIKIRHLNGNTYVLFDSDMDSEIPSDNGSGNPCS